MLNKLGIFFAYISPYSICSHSFVKTEFFMGYAKKIKKTYREKAYLGLPNFVIFYKGHIKYVFFFKSLCGHIFFAFF
jgi:hypothetical protein